MITKRNGLKSLLAALSLTACATGHAQVLGGQLTGNSGVAGSLGGSLGSPAINGTLDGTVSGALDADTTGLRRASERGVDSTTAHTRRAKRTATAAGEKPAKRSEQKHAASLASTSAATSVSALQAEPAGNAKRRPEPVMPAIGSTADGALDGGARTATPGTAEASTSATVSGSAQASVE